MEAEYVRGTRLEINLPRLQRGYRAGEFEHSSMMEVQTIRIIIMLTHWLLDTAITPTETSAALLGSGSYKIQTDLKSLQTKRDAFTCSCVFC